MEDPLYNRPVIDSQTDITSPVPHRKVSGHFEGTDKKFTFYFPLKSQWGGRFYQQLYPLQDENASDRTVEFGVESGAYTVQTNGGGGYRVDAAVAQFSRKVAAEYYETSERIYGYVYGGSGGSLQTLGAIECTTGVWDGAVPFIPAIPTSIPNNFFIRAFAGFVLGVKAQQIADAVSPGGSGAPYSALNDVEREVLLEVTKLGIPLRAWEDYPYLLGLNNPQGLLDFGGMVRGMDPTYVEDFWSKPGYIGTEQSELGDLFRHARVDHVATITQVSRNEQGEPTSLTLASVPTVPVQTGADYVLYAADGTSEIGTLAGSLDPVTRIFKIANGTPDKILNSVEAGATIRIDNCWSLALLSYHRHQVPNQAGHYGWDHLKLADGSPIYPQRPLEIGPIISRNVTGGGTHSGQIQGKVILVANLLDADAYPWHADWYSAKVKENLGEHYDDNFRLWYNDHADHIQYGPRNHILVQYDGIYERALRDLSVWVEKGVEPAQSTCYEVVDSQIRLPEKVEVCRGIQPVIGLTVNGDVRIEIAAGEAVTFTARIKVPPKQGEVVSLEWDFEGNGNFTEAAFNTPGQTVEVTTTYTFSTPGNYYPAIRVTVQREGEASMAYARVQNLGRARVGVR
ncbi:Tat pathway signal sequence domain protein [Paenibacillus sp. FSL H7-0326]|nr:Tat pathway signal sequence domain protein [Paenibacillus sp. FSL H7-0326]